MKLMLHIVRKDLMRLRWPWAAWLAILGAKYAIGYAAIWGGIISSGMFQRLEMVITALRVSEVIAAFFLTALLVQGDVLVGSRQFWLTRPISGARLLGAKLHGVLLLMMAPALALALPWWWVCGFDATLMAGAALELVAWQLLAMVPAFLIAALTDTFGRFIMWSIILIWLAVMAPFYTQWASAKWEEGQVGTAGALVPERMIIVSAVFVVIVAIVVIMQYLGRRWVRSVIVLVSGSLLAVGIGVVGTRWFEAESKVRRTQQEWNVERAAGVRLAWAGASADKGGAQPEARRLFARTWLVASGVPDGHWLTGAIARHSWRWPDGTAHDGQTWLRYEWGGQERAVRQFLGLSAAKTDEETQAWLREHPLRKRLPLAAAPASSVPPDHNVWTELRTSTPMLEKIRREPSQFRLEADFRLMQPRVLLEARTYAGPWLAREGRGLRVVQSGREGHHTFGWDQPRAAMAFTTVESYPDVAMEFLGDVVKYTWSRRSRSWWNPSVVVFNRKYGLAGFNYGSRIASLRIASVELYARRWTATVPKVVRNGEWVMEHPDWFDGAEMAVIEEVAVANFTRVVTVADFQVGK